MQIGDMIKVFLPGESPWAEVIEINEPLFKGRIANRLFHEMSFESQGEFTGDNFGTADPLPKLHDFKQDDEVWFERQGKHQSWEPVDRH